jgi:hypothetical protein
MLKALLLLALAGDGSWNNLAQLRPGQRVEVVDMKLKSVTGEFSGYSADSLSLRAGGTERTIARADVLSVKNRERSHRRNVLLGLAMGAGVGMAAGAIRGATYHEEGEWPVFMMVYTPIAAGIGAVAGAVMPAGEITIYRATHRSDFSAQSPRPPRLRGE